MEPVNQSREPRSDSGQRSVRRLLTLQEVAAVLGVSTATIRRFIWSGKLPTVRLTRRIQVDLRDVDRLIEQAKTRTG